MFKKKETKITPALNITLYGVDQIEFYKGPLLNLTPRDSLIIEKSIQFFNDANPCFLHRSAVIKRILFELEDCFITLLDDKKRLFSWEQLPINVRHLLDGAGSIETVEVEWEEKSRKDYKL